METPMYNAKGKEAGNVQLSDIVFGAKYNGDLVHQVVTGMRANKRAGIAHTKDRSEVSGTGAKPWRQKGTGRARHGSRRSPIWRTGGVAHGPRNEKNYDKKINKKMRAQALYQLLSKKYEEGKVLFVDDLAIKDVSTKKAHNTFMSLQAATGFETLMHDKPNNVFVITPEMYGELALSTRNLSQVTVEDVKNVNALDIAQHRYIVVVDPEKAQATLERRIEKKEKAVTAEAAE